MRADSPAFCFSSCFYVLCQSAYADSLCFISASMSISGYTYYTYSVRTFFFLFIHHLYRVAAAATATFFVFYTWKMVCDASRCRYSTLSNTVVRVIIIYFTVFFCILIFVVAEAMWKKTTKGLLSLVLIKFVQLAFFVRYENTCSDFFIFFRSPKCLPIVQCLYFMLFLRCNYFRLRSLWNERQLPSLSSSG